MTLRPRTNQEEKKRMVKNARFVWIMIQTRDDTNFIKIVKYEALYLLERNHEGFFLSPSEDNRHVYMNIAN